jgi:hypothetical protein
LLQFLAEPLDHFDLLLLGRRSTVHVESTVIQISFPETLLGRQTVIGKQLTDRSNCRQ